MALYQKTIEAYRLGDKEQPKWIKDALIRKEIIFERQTMIDGETFEKIEKAIVGIRQSDRVYPIDSYIVRDEGHIKIISAYDFERQGFVRESD